MGYYATGFGLYDYICITAYFKSLSVYVDCIAALTLRGSRTVVMGSCPMPPEALRLAGRHRLREGAGTGTAGATAVPLTAAEGRALSDARQIGSSAGWYAFLCDDIDGRRDVIYGRPVNATSLCEAEKALKVVWPLMRRTVLSETGRASDLSDAAMLWAMSCKSDLATFVVRQDGEIVEMNDAALEVVARSSVLSERSGRIEAAAPEFRTSFARALQHCAECTDPADARATLILGSQGGDPGRSSADRAGEDAPVSLARFFMNGRPTDLVVVTVPTPPRRHRIAKLASIRGLTRTEVRIAELLHRGLTNRELSAATGLTEETVKTYAKRVLGKLNVSRSGLAHLLTWQAHGGRMQ